MNKKLKDCYQRIGYQQAISDIVHYLNKEKSIQYIPFFDFYKKFAKELEQSI